MSISKSEKSFIQASLLAEQPVRADGRGLTDYRPISLSTGAAPLANGSSRVNIGGTEVIAAVKLEVEDVEPGDQYDQGRVSCSVSCWPSAYPHLTAPNIDDLQSDLSSILSTVLTHPSLIPINLCILRGKKRWLLHVDAVVLSDSGNVYDSIFIAARAALWDTRVPRTRGVEYRAPETKIGDSFKTAVGRSTSAKSADFELNDYWDEGEILQGRHLWPICITLNILPPIHILDASCAEELAVPLKLLLFFSFPTPLSPVLQGTRLIGLGRLDFPRLKALINEGERYACELYKSLDVKLRDEDRMKRV